MQMSVQVCDKAAFTTQKRAPGTYCGLRGLQMESGRSGEEKNVLPLQGFEALFLAL